MIVINNVITNMEFAISLCVNSAKYLYMNPSKYFMKNIRRKRIAGYLIYLAKKNLVPRLVYSHHEPISL